MERIRKFVIIGPESTGKSTLCNQLAHHYRTHWVPEYARMFLEKNGTVYTYDDLLTIAKGQIGLEEDTMKEFASNTAPCIKSAAPAASSQKPGKGLLFIDTDLYVMKVWCEFVFNKCHSWILNRIAERNYDGYLLCNIDIPWVKDNLREYPDEKTRNALHHFYKDLLINQPAPWVNINGSYPERLEKAITFIDNKIKEPQAAI